MKPSPIEKGWQKFEGKKTDSIIKRLLEPRVILFGLVLSNFVLNLTTVTRLIRENLFVEAPYWYFGVAMTRPLILLFGAVCVLIRRGWSHALAVVLAGTVLHSEVYRAFVGISYAHGIPIIGARAVRIWFQVTSSTQLISATLAAAITVTAMIQLVHRFRRRFRDATTIGRESPTLSKSES